MVHRETPPGPPLKRSAAVRALIRRGAGLVLNPPPEWIAEIRAALLSTPAVQAIADDPVLAAGIERATYSNLMHWAESNIRDPGAPVSPNVGDEVISVARDLVRRGLDARALHTHRTGQSAAWLRWMEICFTLTQDPVELRELLSVTARSITEFNEACIAELTVRMEAERAELTRGTHAERRATVALLVEGAPIPMERAERTLGYTLSQEHRAAVAWWSGADVKPSALEQIAESLAGVAGTPRFLSVVASAGTLWLWLPTGEEPDTARLEAVTQELPDVRIALGSRGQGVEGFRRSHLDALTAQRMLARVSSPRRVVSFDRVRLVSLIVSDPESAGHFIRDTLGELETAEADLRTTVEIYLEEGCNAARAAERLSVHRNTLLRRLETVDTLLPRPLQDARVHVGVALEVLRWR